MDCKVISHTQALKKMGKIKCRTCDSRAEKNILVLENNTVTESERGG